jgi:poly(hydroxyalkanoate) depolymerase family esterase
MAEDHPPLWLAVPKLIDELASFSQPLASSAAPPTRRVVKRLRHTRYPVRSGEPRQRHERGIHIAAVLMRIGLTRPNILGFLSRSLGAALLTIGIIGGGIAAEPHQETRFGSNPGDLRMFSYVPAHLAPGAPLIVVLHGCKQKAVTFASDSGWLALADRSRAALLLPEQKGLPSYLYDAYLMPGVAKLWGANNQNACFNWFEPDDTARDRGEALSIRQMIDAMVERHSVDGSRVYIVGLSAGGAMTAAMLAAYPERFAAGAIVAGVPYGCADSVTKALQCMNPGINQSPAEWRRRVREVAGGERRIPPVSIWHGTADGRVVLHNWHELVEQWTAVHDVSTKPVRGERNGPVTRNLYHRPRRLRVGRGRIGRGPRPRVSYSGRR